MDIGPALRATAPLAEAAAPAEWLDTQLTPVLLSIILLAAAGTTLLFLIGVVAYGRHRSTRYLLITLALGALVGRSIFGLGTVFGLFPMTIHHLVEHSLDFAIAVLVLYAVYRSGPDDAAESGWE